MTLHKVQDSDIQRIIRFCYAEDPELISAYKIGNGNDLDSCVSTALALITQGSSFFKVETNTGAIVGYFTQAPIVNANWTLQGFIIRQAFREQYTSSFFDLISSSFQYQLPFSVDQSNFIDQSNLKNNYTITNQTFFSNKNYLLLKTYTA